MLQAAQPRNLELHANQSATSASVAGAAAMAGPEGKAAMMREKWGNAVRLLVGLLGHLWAILGNIVGGRGYLGGSWVTFGEGRNK